MFYQKCKNIILIVTKLVFIFELRKHGTSLDDKSLPLYLFADQRVASADKKRILSMRILNSVPGAGVEPARIAPSVFETDASTDSAIRALLMQR